MHEKGCFKPRVKYKKFSIGKQLLPVIKKLYPDAPFDVAPEGMKLSGSLPWWQAAKSAIMEHFKIEKLHDDKKGGGLCIQDWDLDWDLIHVRAIALSPFSPIFSILSILSILSNLSQSLHSLQPIHTPPFIPSANYHMHIH